MKECNYSVYLLPKENYVGYTSRKIESRIAEHKCHHNRDTEDYRILFNVDTLEEAIELEDLMHSLGYKGDRNNLNGKTMVIDESTGIFYRSRKEAWRSYGRHSYRYFLEMLDGRKNNKTNYKVI